MRNIPFPGAPILAFKLNNEGAYFGRLVRIDREPGTNMIYYVIALPTGCHVMADQRQTMDLTHDLARPGGAWRLSLHYGEVLWLSST